MTKRVRSATPAERRLVEADVALARCRRMFRVSKDLAKVAEAWRAFSRWSERRGSALAAVLRERERDDSVRSGDAMRRAYERKGRVR